MKMLCFIFINMAYFLTNSLIDYGFIIRGAITIGDLYHDERIVFGPALNQAYEIESTIANYPRVIVDKRIVPTHIKECYDVIPYEAEYKYEVKYFNII